MVVPGGKFPPRQMAIRVRPRGVAMSPALIDACWPFDADEDEPRFARVGLSPDVQGGFVLTPVTTHEPDVHRVYTNGHVGNYHLGEDLIAAGIQPGQYVIERNLPLSRQVVVLPSDLAVAFE